MNQGTNHTGTTSQHTTSQHTNPESSQTGFNSQPQTGATNPFATDMRGEFTSNFGTNTNAVSQIFRDGNFGANGNSRLIIVGLAVLLLGVAAAFFLLKDDEDPFEDVAEQVENPVSDVVEEEAALETEALDETEGLAEEGGLDESAQVEEAAAPMEMSDMAAVGGGTITLMSPAAGDSRTYDETMGPAVFTWEGGGGSIAFSRSRSMNPAYIKTSVSGNSYAFHNPYPGTWYWQVSTPEGSSEVRSFSVQPALPRNIAIREPAPGSALSGNGGVVSWGGDSKVAFYRVELSAGNGWANPAYKFSTSGESTQLQGVNPGSYELRIGAFSEVAGRWEYTRPVNVTVQ